MKKVRKIFLSLVCASLFLTPITALADTAIHVHNATDQVTGFTFDSTIENGLIYVNPKGLQKKALWFQDNPSIEWNSRYGSVTFNQWGQDFPYAGMNEKGLCIIRISEDSPDDSLPQNSILGLQWIQYHLDQYGSVQELLDQPLTIPSFAHFGPMHYLVSDPSNQTIVIEFRKGEPVVFNSMEPSTFWPVLTEIPYQNGIDTLSSPPEIAKEATTPLDRFVKMAALISDWNQNEEGSLYLRAFDMLLNAATGETKWNILFHLNERSIYFRTFSHDRIKIISFSNLDFSCEKPIRYWSVDLQEPGDISNLFRNKAIKPDASWESIHLLSINTQLGNPFSLSEMQTITQFPYSFTCNMKDIPTTDADRLQKYALWWIAITAILAAILFIVKGLKNRKKSLENQSKMGNQKPKEMYKKYKNTNKKKPKRKK